MTANRKDDSREEMWQAAAEQPDSDVQDHFLAEDAEAIAQYRQIYEAIAAAEIPEIPEDFARTLESMTTDYEEQADLEIWIVRLSCLIGAGTLAWIIVAFGHRLLEILPKLPSGAPFLAIAAASLLAATAIDRVLRPGDTRRD